MALLAIACGRSALDEGEVGFYAGAGPTQQAGSGPMGGRAHGGAGGSVIMGGTFGTAGQPVFGGETGQAGLGGSAGSVGGDGGTAGCPAQGCPTQEPPQLWAGYYHTCAKSAAGALKCWGHNNAGQLGYGNVEDLGDNESPYFASAVSVSDEPGVTVTQVAGGLYHTCALLSDGQVRCWGLGGRIGSGSPDRIGDDELPSSAKPVSISTDPSLEVVQLAAGFFHTCALLSDGSVKCFGDNNLGGQLGLGDPNLATIGDDELPSSVGPVQVTSDPDVVVVSLVAGAYHTCALLSDDSVKCWGGNADGELGYGNTDDIGDDELPSSVGAVSVTSDATLSVKALAAGSFHTCALLSDGSVTCWGGGVVGKLGYGNTEDIGDDEFPSSAGAIQLSKNLALHAIALSAGGEHSCALLSDHSVVCWGYSNEGELGHGSKANVGDNEVPASLGPVPLEVSAAIKVSTLCAGGEHTCAGFTDGTVKCWGANFYGQLGYSSTKNIGDDELPTDVGAVPLF